MFRPKNIRIVRKCVIILIWWRVLCANLVNATELLVGNVRNWLCMIVVRVCRLISGIRSRRSDILSVGVPVNICVVTCVKLLVFSDYVSLGSTVVICLLIHVGRGNSLVPVVSWV